MEIKEFKKDQQIYFDGEKASFKVIAISENYAICTRKLHRRYDADLLKHQVEMGGYFSFTEAYNHQKDEIVYSILDFKNMKRAPHNLVFNPYDFKDTNSLNELLNDLESCKVELSRRNGCKLNLKDIKTDNIVK